MRLFELPLEENLAPFSQFLWQHRVAHRIFEESGRQIVEIADAAQAEDVRRAYQAWRAGTLEIRVVSQPRPAGAAALARFGSNVLRYPGVLLVLLVSLLVFPFSLALGDGQASEIALALTIVDLRSAEPVGLLQVLTDRQVWRWLTPIFLHFSVVHLVFNSVVTFDLGRRLEAQKGSAQFLLVVVIVGVASNLSQMLFNSNPFFGGLSGVGYGLLGYLLVMQRRFPANPAWRLPAGFAIGLIVFLVIFSTGVTEPFGLHVANAAHWSGLIIGAAIALLSGGGVASRDPMRGTTDVER